uniref:thiol oxidase n=1 Tax=viral metagenome TaxID=1070528 RepID=A0A6C0JJE7_9ZZZZ
MNLVFFNNNKNNIQQNYPKPIIQHQFANRISVQRQIARDIVVDPVIQPTQKSKMLWGEPTWFLFHTLAQKVKDEYFLEIKNELIGNIFSICYNLPCPKCQAHASEYVKKVNINSIKTKDDLKNFLFKFHNDVSSMKGNPIFPYDQLNEKYSKAITVNVINNFFVFFQDKSFNVTAISNSMHRTRTIALLKIWFSNKIQYFDP